MSFSNADSVRDQEFIGFVEIRSLRKSKYALIPERRGVYVILRTETGPPGFLSESTAGRHKGVDPTLPIEELEKAWVSDSQVLYIGKAGASGKKATLRSRIRSYLRQGAGRKAGHFGGRMIWQLANSDEFLVAWREEPKREPLGVESELIEEFVSEYGVRPFANRRD